MAIFIESIIVVKVKQFYGGRVLHTHPPFSSCNHHQLALHLLVPYPLAVPYLPVSAGQLITAWVAPIRGALYQTLRLAQTP